MSTPQDKARAEAEKEYPMMSGVNISERVENAISEERRAAFIKGYLRACEHSPDIVEKVMDVVNQLVIWDGTSLGPNGGDAEAECRTRLTSLFKPQP